MRAALAFTLALLLGCTPPTLHVAARSEPEPKTSKPRSPAESANAVLGRLLAELSSAVSGVYRDARLAAYVTQVGLRVARASDRPEQDWHFHVSDDDDVAAFALPGGHVLVSRGALSWLSSEAELAAVLAHEVAHSARRHPRAIDDESAVERSDADAIERAAALDADQERQADSLAVEYLARAGYDPRAMGGALRALQRGASFECRRSGRACPTEHDPADPHPASPARLARVALAARGRAGETATARFLARVHGMEVGPSSRRPRITRQRYVAPGVLSVALPAEHTVEQSGALVSTQGAGPRVSILRLHGSFWRTTVRRAFEDSPHQWRRVAGFPTLVGRMGDDEHSARAALLDTGEDSFVVALQDSGAPAARALEQLLRSARREAPVGEPLRRLSVVRAQQSTTLRALTARACPRASLQELTALNGREPDARMPTGSMIKCVSGLSL